MIPFLIKKNVLFLRSPSFSFFFKFYPMGNPVFFLFFLFFWKRPRKYPCYTSQSDALWVLKKSEPQEFLVKPPMGVVFFFHFSEDVSSKKTLVLSLTYFLNFCLRGIMRQVLVLEMKDDMKGVFFLWCFFS